MALANFNEIMLTLIASAAGLAAITGLIVLESFFRNKLKELFEDTQYLISFFLVSGYLLYALGEVSFYLMRVVFQETSTGGIQDVYWSGGAFLILVSFIALTLTLYRESRQPRSLTIMAGLGVLLLVVVLTLTLNLKGTFLTHFYPIISALIVTFASSVLLFRERLGSWGRIFQLFFLASCAILLGDIFFGPALTATTYGTAGIAADIFYLAGYVLSAVAFITFRLQFHKAALRNF